MIVMWVIQGTLPVWIYESKRHISLNRRCPRIVAAQSEALERNKYSPQIVATASKHGMLKHVRMISVDSRHARTVLYKSFPKLTAGLRGCTYY